MTAADTPERVRVSVDVDRCCGSGQCGLTAPDVFDQDEDGIVVLLTPEPPAAATAAVLTAADCCPVQAITVESITVDGG